MSFLNEGLAALALVGVALTVLIVLRPALTVARGGKVLAFIALFIMPVLATWIGTNAHLEHSKSTTFCLSCHVMEPYGTSLHIDDAAYLPAAHYQNNRVPRGEACYTCHTDYTMFGGIKSKLRGVRHVYVYFLGAIPRRIKLYKPYQNRECLHCHARARNFEARDSHRDVRQALSRNEISCLECHDTLHAVQALPGLKLWKEAQK